MMVKSRKDTKFPPKFQISPAPPAPMSGFLLNFAKYGLYRHDTIRHDIMIKSLALKNWKSFEDARLWVDPLTFIIGTNAAGKSNIVDALSFLSCIASGTRLSDVPVRGGIDGLIRRTASDASLAVEVVTDKGDFFYEICFQTEDKELLIHSEKLSLTQSDGKCDPLFSASLTGPEASRLSVFFSSGLLFAARRDVSVLAQIANLNVSDELKILVDEVAASLKSIFIFDPKPDKMRDYSPLADKLASDGSNIAGVIAGLPDDRQKEFEEQLTDYVRPLPDKDLIKIWAEPVGRFKSDAMLYCAEEWVDGEKTEFDARAMSDGSLRFIAIVTALMSARKGDTIVIEEVDNGLHPSRAGELVMALKALGRKKGIDIISTTHNPVLIDALGPEMLQFISYVSRSEATGCSEIRLLEDAPDLLRLLANYTPGDMMTRGLLSNDAK